MKFRDIPVNNYFRWNSAFYKKVSTNRIRNIYGGEVSFFAQNEKAINSGLDLDEILPKSFHNLDNGDYFRLKGEKQLYYKLSDTSMRKYAHWEGSIECHPTKKVDFVGNCLAIHFYSLEQWDTPTFFQERKTYSAIKP